MKNGLFFLVFSLWCCTYTSCASIEKEREEIVIKMQKYFEHTLQENYGNCPDTTLYRMFFENYNDNDDYILHTNREKIKEINTELFQDSIYSFFYDNIYVVSTYDSIKIMREQLASELKYGRVISQRDANGTTKFRFKYETYCNQYEYLEKRIFINSGSSKIIKGAATYSVAQYQQNMKILAGIILEFPEELKLAIVKEYIAVVYWNYICQCSNYNLHQRKKIGKYDLY